MTDNEYVHMASIMEAAMPHIDTRARSTLDIMTKLLALMGSIRNLSKSNMAACGYENKSTDLESLLTAIRPHCFGRELAFIDQILSMFQAKRMYETYKTVMEAMKTMQGFEGSPFADFTKQNDGEGNPFQTSDFDFSGFFNGFQQAADFKETDDPEHKNQERDYEGQAHLDQAYQDQEHLGQAYQDQEHFDQDFQDQLHEDREYKKEAPEGETSKETDNHNSNMFDMLKEMIPPEQRSTFENLSMLLKTMSYDNNKQEQKKEN